jgi:flagellar hook-basal body complex protein FliE
MIDSIQHFTHIVAKPDIETNKLAKTSDASFEKALEAAKQLLEKTNEAEQITNELTYDFITGKNDNIHSLMIAQEKSGILLQFTMQVRNQLVDAYKEIMRISV